MDGWAWVGWATDEVRVQALETRLAQTEQALLEAIGRVNEQKTTIDGLTTASSHARAPAAENQLVDTRSIGKPRRSAAMWMHTGSR